MVEIGSNEHLDWDFEFILEFNRLLHLPKNYGMTIDLMKTTWKMYKTALRALQETEKHWSWVDTPPPHLSEFKEKDE